MKKRIRLGCLAAATVFLLSAFALGAYAEAAPDTAAQPAQLTQAIDAAVQDGTQLADMDAADMDALAQQTQQLQQQVEQLPESQQQSLDEAAQDLENLQASVQEAQTVEAAKAAGTLDQLEESGLENSWRYQNGELVDASVTTLPSAGVGGGTLQFRSLTIRDKSKVYRGIDVSHHQGVIDWDAVKNSGQVDFVILHCGYGQDQTDQDDAQWARNVSECERLGIPYGVYLYSYATSAERAQGEAQHALRLLSGHHPSFPVFIDLEANVTAIATDDNPAELGAIAQTFCDAMQNAGYSTGVYASASWWQNRLTASNFSNDTWYHWVAQWGTACTYTGRYEAWQYGGAAVSGITGSSTVDMDYWYGELPNYTGWMQIDGKDYWYENDIRQGTEGRGKEIYDPASAAWYWLDAVQGGAKAVSKDVYQDSSGGKWVRYDENGHMIKGWQTTAAGTYYFDPVTGAMAKGAVTIDGTAWGFNPDTGIALKAGWLNIGGSEYWYENGIRQGYDPANPAYRGKEIYDPGSDAWYWLDNVQGGAKAVSKDVYQDSSGGKWVRYDANGRMIKGWQTTPAGTFYFDPVTGAMAKGYVTIDGATRYFDPSSGVLRS